MDQIHSDTSGIVWPALPAPAAASLLALLYQLENSQWWPQEKLEAWQFHQLEKLLTYATNAIPTYREHLSAIWQPGQPLTAEVFYRIPVLSRSDIQEFGDKLYSPALTSEHGTYRNNRTSGSTGRPLEFRLSKLFDFIWSGINLRGYRSQHIDTSRTMAYIRPFLADSKLPEWLEPINLVYDSGPAATLDICTPIEKQTSWLEELNPDYLFTGPTNLHALAQAFLERKHKLPALKCIRTVGETLKPATRQLVHDAFGIRVLDIYGTSEAGTLAIECGDAPGHYHIQSEAAFVEILHEDGTACAPGEIGQLVITPLHNFAMPLIRYAIGDFAEVGKPCPCGRGLPTLGRILGRSRNRFLTPQGWRWPYWQSVDWISSLGGLQYQVTQHALDDIEIKLFSVHPLDEHGVATIRQQVIMAVGYQAPIRITLLEKPQQSNNGKFEDFVCLIEA